MTEQKKALGRPESVADEDKKASMTASIMIKHQKKIKAKYGSLTNAVKQEIITKLK